MDNQLIAAAERVAKVDPLTQREGGTFACLFCNYPITKGQKVYHTSDCPWVDLRNALVGD